ncbi:hypothetical protein XI05_04845 [Bradyrhizobium sp. CCBAU 11357]|nr:hypothetical protein [Bradyrhizobium sp. CCBAU 11357]
MPPIMVIAMISAGASLTAHGVARHVSWGLVTRHDLKRAIEILEEFNRPMGVDRDVNSMSAPYVRLAACWETRMASRKPLRQ